jgi:hypothetical protein
VDRDVLAVLGASPSGRRRTFNERSLTPSMADAVAAEPVRYKMQLHVLGTLLGMRDA